MTIICRFALTLMAPVALTACGDSTADLKPTVPDETSLADTGQAPDQPLPNDDGGFGENVVEVDPEIGGTEPMDSGQPMADAAPMSDDFGENDYAVE